MRPIRAARGISPARRWPSLPASGLGQFEIPQSSVGKAGPTSSEDPWWLRIAMPFAEAGAHRIAHGQTLPGYGIDFRYGNPYASVHSPGYGYSGFGGGLTQYLPLIIGGVVVLAVLNR